MIDKPKLSICLELLKAKKEAEFMQLVGPTISALIHEKPWDHQWYMQPLIFGSQNATWICVRCKDDRCAKGKDLPRNGCPVPPPLTECPEKLAFILRDQCRDKSLAVDIMKASCIIAKTQVDEHTDPVLWYSIQASSFEQILVCLLALDQIEKD